MPQKKSYFPIVLSVLMIMSFFSCGSEEDGDTNTPASEINASTVGSGSYDYTYQVDNFRKVLKVYYHIPESKTTQTPILIALHGQGRNADDYRNALKAQAEALDIIVIAPEFSDENFPGSDQYNLGNVYQDGDDPTVNSLNPESEWSYSIVEPLFDQFKDQIGHPANTYSLFGHSAGAQFAHRFLMFKPNNRAAEIVISAAGWYTFPDNNTVFPYGIKKSVIDENLLEVFLGKNIIVQVGALDNDPEAPGLRRNSIVDLQGIHRLARATNFFDFCETLAEDNQYDFPWRFEIREGADHNFSTAAVYAADLLFK